MAANVCFNSSIGLPKEIYHVLGEDIQVSGMRTIELVSVICTLNVLGKPYYDELKKNQITFPKEIEDYLKIKFRDLKIDSILSKD
jgi:hypothetical protein